MAKMCTPGQALCTILVQMCIDEMKRCFPDDTSHRPNFPGGREQAIRSTTLFKLKSRNWTRLVLKPNWTRSLGKSGNVYRYSGTRTFWFYRDRSNTKTVYRSTHFHFCPSISSNLASVPISSNLLK